VTTRASFGCAALVASNSATARHHESTCAAPRESGDHRSCSPPSFRRSSDLHSSFMELIISNSDRQMLRSRTGRQWRNGGDTWLTDSVLRSLARCTSPGSGNDSMT